MSTVESPSSSIYHPAHPQLRHAWAAGFLDGEGCIHIAKQRYRSARSDNYRLYVRVTQNQRGVLERFRDAVGIHAPIYATKRATNHRRQCFTLNFSGPSARALLNLLLQYLDRKKEEAEAALDFIADGRVGERWGPGGVDPAVVAIREHYFQLLKQLK